MGMILRLLVIYALLSLTYIPMTKFFLQVYGSLFEALRICKADDPPVLYLSLVTTFTLTSFPGVYFGIYKESRKGKLGIRMRLRDIVALAIFVGIFIPTYLIRLSLPD
mgnify:CR=1 FL=1